jgi:hypothetical protein
MRLALRGMVDSEPRVPCHSLAPQTCDGTGSKRPVLRLSEGSRMMLWESRKFSFFSLQKRKINLPSPLSHPPPASIGNCIQEPLCRGGGVNGFSPSPVPFPYPTSQHRESQHIHLAVSLIVGRCFDPADQNKMLSSLHSPFKIISYSLHPA